jgi:hypothetical protein
MTTKQNITASRFRREVRLSQHKIAADPISGLNKDLGVSVYFVIDEPKSGVYSDLEIGYLIDALKTWLSSGNYTKVLGGEFFFLQRLFRKLRRKSKRQPNSADIAR